MKTLDLQQAALLRSHPATFPEIAKSLVTI